MNQSEHTGQVEYCVIRINCVINCSKDLIHYVIKLTYCFCKLIKLYNAVIFIHIKTSKFGTCSKFQIKRHCIFERMYYFAEEEFFKRNQKI